MNFKPPSQAIPFAHQWPFSAVKSHIKTREKASRWERSRCNDNNSTMQWCTKHAELWDWRRIFYVNT